MKMKNESLKKIKLDISDVDGVLTTGQFHYTIEGKAIKTFGPDDNDGLSDSNQPFNEDSWFWKYIKNDLEYYSIEVYHQPINQMKKLHDMLLMNLKKN